MTSRAPVLGTLPEELKQRIVDLVHGADENYGRWTRAVRRRRDRNFDWHEFIRTRGWPNDGNGIERLSRVSKEWRERTARYIFGDIGMWQLIDPIYALKIGRRRAPVITHLRITTDPVWAREQDQDKRDRDASIIQAVGRMLDLPGLKSVSIEGGAILDLFHTSPLRPGSDMEAAYKAFSGVAESIEALTATEISTPLEMYTLGHLFSNLTVLKVTTLPSVDGPVLGHGAHAICDLKNLRRLELEMEPELDLTSLIDARRDKLSFPPLSSLSLTSLDMHESWIVVANLVARSLLSLNLRATATEGRHAVSPPPFLFTATLFPLLRALSFTAIQTSAEALLLSATRTSFPHLVDLSVGMSLYRQDLGDELSVARRIVSHARKVVPLPGRVRIFDELETMPPSFTRVAPQHEIRVTPCSPFPSEALLENRWEVITYEKSLGDTWHREDLSQAIGLAIEHLVDLKKRADISNRAQDWMRLEKLVQEAEYDRVCMES
ncbi:hypothetical protein JCM11491_003921 [Sporobolomyces phaffii]